PRVNSGGLHIRAEPSKQLRRPVRGAGVEHINAVGLRARGHEARGELRLVFAYGIDDDFHTFTTLTEICEDNSAIFASASSSSGSTTSAASAVKLVRVFRIANTTAAGAITSCASVSR